LAGQVAQQRLAVCFGPAQVFDFVSVTHVVCLTGL